MIQISLYHGRYRLFLFFQLKQGGQGPAIQKSPKSLVFRKWYQPEIFPSVNWRVIPTGISGLMLYS